MQFKHPEILYALLLLLIPILVHLFQLRRFKKEAFTNVKFLKAVTLQTRKSSQIKKWLILTTRLLLLGAIILAFAQPYFAKTNTYNSKSETVIYLDNSFSTQAKGAKGKLLQRAVQDILSVIPESEEFTLFTNSETYRNITTKSIKNDLLQVSNSPNQVDYNSVILKGRKAFTDDPTSIKNLILVSDFQQQKQNLKINRDSVFNLHLVKMVPVNSNNIQIDSLYISKTESSTLELTVLLKNQGNTVENLPVSLINNEELLAKTAVTIDDEAKATFSIARNTPINGRIVIDDTSLEFDNEFFFNINTTEKIKVLSINNASDSYLKRIFTDDEFEYLASNSNTLNYNVIEDQNLIILNELKDIPISLTNALVSFKNNGGSVLIIPSEESLLNSYNQLFTNFNYTGFIKQQIAEKKLTKINYSHPLYQGVFDKQVSNFQYPKVKKYYAVNKQTSGLVLQLEDGNPLLNASNNLYVFTAPLNKENSNFINSPLIVPTLYNIGRQSLQIPKLYYTIGNENKVDVPITMRQDEILKLENEDISLIPQQQTYSNKVSLIINDELNKSGVYSIVNDTEKFNNISFNFNRNESDLSYINLDNFEGVSVSESFINTFTNIKSDAKVNELWKWFVIFALVFLLLELLILKYFK